MKRIPRLTLLAFVAAATSALIGCSAGGASPPPNAGASGAAAPAVSVTTAPVVQKSVPREIATVGTAEAFTTVAVHAQLTGELISVGFKDGDDVTKGQVLFTLDRRPLEAMLKQAEANLARDTAQAANARAQLKRYQDLADRGIATREQVDQITTTATALDATVEADRAAVENANVQLQYATIPAAIPGRTGKLMVHAGSLVRSNDTVPLVVINQIAPIYVSFSIPEAQLTEFKQFMAAGALRVQARAPDDPGPPSVGHVSFIDNAVDQTTGTIAVRGVFANDNRRLWPGQFVNVTVTLTKDANVLVVPSTAVQNSQQGPYVFVVKPDQTVELRPVQVTRTAGVDTIVHSGVKAGDVVVTEGHLRLVPGSRISVRTEGERRETP